MPDSYYLENRTAVGPNKPDGMWSKVKLVDNGDTTFSISAMPAGLAYRNVAGAATTLVKSGGGVLHRIIVNKPVSLSVITVYDSLTASGTKIATLTNPLALLQQQVCLDFGVQFATGLTVVTSAGDDVTVAYR